MDPTGQLMGGRTCAGQLGGTAAWHMGLEVSNWNQMTLVV